MDEHIKILTSTEVEKILRVSKKTLHLWSKNGKLGRKVGRRWKYRLDEIEALLNPKPKE